MCETYPTLSIKVAPTIEDIESSDAIAAPHLAEAVQYRKPGSQLLGIENGHQPLPSTLDGSLTGALLHAA